VRVLVGGLLRNGEAAVGRITQLALDLQREFGDVIVHVFENNSTDDTPALLMQAAREQPNLFARCEVWDINAFRESGKARTWDNGCCRLELIAEARNRLLDWMRESALADDDRFVMIDWDFATAPPSMRLFAGSGNYPRIWTRYSPTAPIVAGAITICTSCAPRSIRLGRRSWVIGSGRHAPASVRCIG